MYLSTVFPIKINSLFSLEHILFSSEVGPGKEKEEKNRGERTKDKGREERRGQNKGRRKRENQTKKYVSEYPISNLSTFMVTINLLIELNNHSGRDIIY